MYNIIKSGSDGNAVLYHSTILADCGVPYKSIEKYVKGLQIVIISHAHSDHLNINTLKRLQFERPTLRIGCGQFVAEKLTGFKNVDVYIAGRVYDYGTFQISPVELQHNVKNYGYRIFKDDHKLIHCTDCSHLQGIEAINYSLYAIEHNYDEETVIEQIEKAEAKGEFSHKRMAINNHLSEQQASEWIYKNKGEDSEILRLHESKT